MRRLLLALVIGSLSGLAQRVLAQEPGAAAVLQVKERADELRRALRRAFDPSKRAEWPTGFQIALDMGATGTALCLDLLRQESHQKRRLLLLAALALTRSQECEDSLLQTASLGKRIEERSLALLALALLANASGAADALGKLVGGNEEEYVQVGACLALARKRQRAPGAQRLAGSDDAALVAAAILTGAGGDRERWWSDKQELPGAHLVRRASFLAGGDVSAETEAEQCARALRTLATPVATRGRSANATRIAAALRLSRCPSVEQSLRGLGSPPPPACLLAIGSEPAGADALRALGWLSPVPTLLPDAEERHRLAVLYASRATFGDLRQDKEAWEQDREISGTIAQTIALRLLRMRADGREPPERMAPPAGAQLERLWLRHACGESALALVETHPDAALRRAYELAIARRLPPDAAADALEQSLVRARRHPGLCATEAWRLLVRDLLLCGSRYAELRFARGEPASLPHGIAADHDDFFEVACELWDFVMRQAPELSPGSRIR